MTTIPVIELANKREVDEGLQNKKIMFADYDPAEYLNSKDDVTAMLCVALEENDPDFLLRVVGNIARSEGMVKIARELNLDRKGLYKSLSLNDNPSFNTVVNVLDNLGYQLSIWHKIPA